MVNAKTALERLMEGNRRFVHLEMQHPHCDAARRKSVANEQKPFAAVLCCSDSRVVPETIFDQGLGDLFVVRVAGNVADEVVTGSLEYAVSHLHVPLIAVMGHTDCGAVKVALNPSVTAQDNQTHRIVSAIRSSVSSEDRNNRTVDTISRLHAMRMTGLLLLTGSILQKEVFKGRLKMVTFFYNLQTGTVETID